MIERKHVEGRRPVDLLLYTLSTCGWCKKTKALLQELGVGYDYVDIDQVDPSDADVAKEEVIKWNPSCSFPTIVVNGNECLVGFQEARLRELVGK
ncbi:MAG TPA: glutaredoxin family protein [Armatimonadota bacterium]|jgi:glutaredoxin